MTDFRAIERDLIEFFKAAGVNVVWIDGEPFITATCCPACSYEYGESVSLTRLAERLAGK